MELSTVALSLQDNMADQCPQSPAHGNETMHVHLPKSQEQFFKSHNTELVEVRAKWYEDDELANTQADTVFDTRPSYIK